MKKYIEQEFVFSQKNQIKVRPKKQEIYTLKFIVMRMTEKTEKK